MWTSRSAVFGFVTSGQLFAPVVHRSGFPSRPVRVLATLTSSHVVKVGLPNGNGG